MYKPKTKASKSSIHRNESYYGETIENKVRRIVNNKEPIKDGAPIIYTDRKDGVQPQFDIRTDRFELAVDAMTTVAKSKVATRDSAIAERNKPKDDKVESIQGTGTDSPNGAETAK